MEKIILVIVFVSVFVSCKQKFDQQKWQIKDDLTYPYRDAMVEDLIKNNKLVGLTYKQLIEQLGEDNGNLGYSIYDDYGWESKSLRFKMNEDSLITKVELHIWNKKGSKILLEK